MQHPYPASLSKRYSKKNKQYKSPHSIFKKNYIELTFTQQWPHFTRDECIARAIRGKQMKGSSKLSGTIFGGFRHKKASMSKEYHFNAPF